MRDTRLFPRRFAGILLLACCLPPSGLHAQDVLSQLKDEARRNRHLEMEYSLVKDAKVYVVLKASEQVIEFRLRGMVLKSLPIQETLVLGSVPRNETLMNLRIKETPKPPQRAKINPMDASSTTTTLDPNAKSEKPGGSKAEPSVTSPQYSDLNGLELKDMPTRFDLVFDGGLAIRVRPVETPVEEKGYQGRLKRWGVWWSDFAAQLQRRFGKPQVPQLRLSMTEDSCRWIFWSMPESTKLLYMP